MSKPVRILGIAGSLRRQSYNRAALRAATSRAPYHLRQVMVFFNMPPLNQPEVMIRAAHERFDADGNLTDEATREYIRRLLGRRASTSDGFNSSMLQQEVRR